MVHLNPVPPPPDALKQSQIDQFTAHVRTVIEGATGQPFGTRASDAVSIFATIISDSGIDMLNKGASPDLAVRWIIGACQAVATTYKPTVVHQPRPDGT